MIRRRKILKLNIRGNERIEKQDVVAVDKPVNIFVNGEHFVILIASPKNIRELAIGHLLGEGVIKKLEDVKQVRVKGINVYIETKEGIDLKTARALRVIPTACGTPEDFIALLRGSKPLKRRRGVRFRVEGISNAFKWLHSRSKVFRETGGTHAAALFTQGVGLKFCAEDVGRHNAVDKIIGWGLLKGVDFSRSFAISSGRLSADIVIKCLRAGIPLVASRAAPLSSGIMAAEMGGLTLVGFVRGAMLNVYAHPERLKL